MTVQDIFDFLNEKAPFATAEDWDNPGLLVGDPHKEITRVVVALDATADVVEFAALVQAQLIITHHPVIFAPLKRLQADSVPYRLAAKDIALIAAHTNLDKAEGGVNDTLAACLRLSHVTVAQDGYTRIGTLPGEMTAEAFAIHVAQALRTPVRTAGEDPVTTVAVCGGGGGDFIAGCVGLADVYVTGEVKHHEWLAAEGHIGVVEAGHYATEVPVVGTLAAWLEQAFPELVVTTYLGGNPYEVIE